MELDEYLDQLNEEISDESVGGFAIDSFPTTAHNKPFKDVMRPAYPNESIIPDTNYDVDAPRILIDFDQVIHKYSRGWSEGIIYDEPVKDVKKVIDYLRKKYQVIIFTSRLSETTHGKKGVDIQKQMIQGWLDEYDIVVDGMTAEKLPASVYIDDRAYCFEGYETGWTKNDVSKVVEKIEENKQY